MLCSRCLVASKRGNYYILCAATMIHNPLDGHTLHPAKYTNYSVCLKFLCWAANLLVVFVNFKKSGLLGFKTYYGQIWCTRHTYLRKSDGMRVTQIHRQFQMRFVRKFEFPKYHVRTIQIWFSSKFRHTNSLKFDYVGQNGE